jgi:hypothetical protein
VTTIPPLITRRIDPAKVTRSALENAASIAALVLTTESLVTDIPEATVPAAAPTPKFLGAPNPYLAREGG